MRDDSRMTSGERDPMELGRQLRAAMTAVGWSEREVARQSTVSPQTVSNILRGRPANYAADDTSWKPRAPQVIAIARALRSAGCAISIMKWIEMAGHDPSRYTGDFVDDAPVTSADDLAKDIKALPVPERRAVETLVRSLRRQGTVGNVLREQGYIAGNADEASDRGAEMMIRGGPSEMTHQGVHAGPDEEVHNQVDEEQHH